MSDYWFARRFPVGHPRHAMGPISREGWLVVLAFVLAMIAGAVIGMWLGLSGAPFWGVISFAVIAIIAGAVLIVMANSKGDHQRTVADYRKQSPEAGMIASKPRS
jgi:purine-cytosine permease-like protein